MKFVLQAIKEDPITFAYYILLYDQNTVHMYVYMFSLSFKIFSLKTCSLNDKSKCKKRKP